MEQCADQHAAEAGDLVRAAAAGDADAWQALVDRFGGLLWSIARSHGLDRVDAADVVQTVWLRLVDNLDRLREPERVAGWLSSTARHESIRVSRQRQRTVPTGDTVVFDRQSPAEGDPAGPLLRRERDASLWKLVEQLPQRAQDLLELLVIDSASSYADVARGLGMPIGSIGPTRQRCLRTLRAKAAIAGVEP